MTRRPYHRAFATLALVLATSCAATTYFLNDQELERFKQAGPVVPELDPDQLVKGLETPGPYRVVSGDLLEINGPPVLFSDPRDGATTRAQEKSVHLARVDAAGAIQVPVAGRLEVRGRTLPEIEAGVTTALYPKFLVKRPSIVVQVATYHRVPVTIVGAVDKPGIHELRSDQLSLYGALTEAGGIVKSGNLVVGARLIRVIKPGQKKAKAVALPVKGLNVPFSNVALQGGETIEIERYEPDTFTVVGLVKKPGAYDYPPEVNYNLMQALAIAGGVDPVADPPYATVFRKDKDGTIIPATFQISGNELVKASGIMLKPGDVIAVQHTAASWTRAFIAEVFRIQLGFFVDQRSL